MSGRSPGPTGRSWVPAAAFLAVACLAALLYLPSLGNGFVNWDDDAMIVENPYIRSLGPASLAWMFTTDHMSAYQPAGWLGYALIYKALGMRPLAFHLASSLVHGLNAGLFFLLSWRLLRLHRASGDGPSARAALLAGAVFAGLLFGLHPLAVETVALASGFADLLCIFFLFLSLLAYLDSLEAQAPSRNRLLALSLTLLAVSGLCRWKGVVLPAAVALLAVHPLARFRKDRGRAWAELAAFAGVAGLILLANALAKAHGAGYGLNLRLLEAGSAVLHYAAKVLWPAGLIPLKELGPAAGFGTWEPLALTCLVTLASAVWARRFPGLLSLWVVFLASLAPPFGLKGPGPLFAQDVHAYLAASAFYLAGGALLARAWAARRGRTALACGAACLLALLAGVSLRQTRVWKDSVSLWTHTLAVDDASHPARTNLAAALINMGREDEAVLHLKDQLARHPGDEMARFNLAQAFFRRGGAFEPDLGKVHNNLGADLFSLGRAEEAAYHLSKALALAPASANTHHNLAAVFLSMGRVREAERHQARWLALAAASASGSRH